MTLRLAILLTALLTVLLAAPARADVTANGGPVRIVRAVGSGEPAPRTVRGPERIAEPATERPDEGRTLRRPAASDPSRSSTTSSSPWWTIVASAIVIGLVVLIGRVWRKHGPRLAGGLPEEAIEWLGRRPIDAKQAIHLVRLGHRILVLGSSAEGLRTLAEIDDPVEVDYLAGLCRRDREQTPMADTFRALIGRFTNGPANEPRADERPQQTRPAQPSRPAASPANPPSGPTPNSAPPAADPRTGTGDDELRRRLAARMEQVPRTGAMAPGEVPGA